MHLFSSCFHFRALLYKSKNLFNVPFKPIIIAHRLFLKNNLYNESKYEHNEKSMTGAFLALAAVSTGNIEPMEACTRAVYIGPEQW